MNTPLTNLRIKETLQPGHFKLLADKGDRTLIMAGGDKSWVESQLKELNKV